MKPKPKIDHLKKTNLDATNWNEKDDAYWKEHLSPEQYAVGRLGHTEPPHQGHYTNYKKQGNYLCSNCGQVLFTSQHKFDSGCGWPSFFQEIDKSNLILKPDHSHGMVRTEVLCSRCHAHLGHVFEDGPQPTGQRYCINSISLVHDEELRES